MLDFTHEQAVEQDIDITPVLDVVFILLLFFVIASAFAVRGMDLDVPPAHSSRALSGRVVELRLDAAGRLFVDETPLERRELTLFLHRTTESFRERPGQIVLKTAPQAPVEALLFVVDAVRRQGGERLVIATSTPHDADTASILP